MKYIKLLIIIITLLTNSCSTSNLKKQIIGTWMLEEIEHNNKSILWNQQWVTIFSFNEDNLCKLPIRDLKHDTVSNWEIISKNDTNYLIITNSLDTLFNNTYKIKLTYRNSIKILELQSNNLSLKCTQ